jgi:sister-chromatid-cohesion protein PDS5
MAVSDKKEMHAKDLLDKTVKGWKYGKDNFLTKLATISQLSSEDPRITDEYNDDILDITIQKTLLKVQTPRRDTDQGWQEDDELDEECQAKCWALKILVNRLKTVEDAETAKVLAGPVYKLLNALISKEGELSKMANTPTHHKTRLRLRAAQLMLKLCRSKVFDELLTPAEFNDLAVVAQDRNANVRRRFIEKLQKYLVKNQLPSRYYTIVFLTNFEPDIDFRNSIITWIRSRCKAFRDRKSHAMESIFPRLLSLLAHHPDYSSDPDMLLDHARYILYYLTTASSEENLALIYKYAERVKQTRDAIDVDNSENLYILCDLAQSVIRAWEQKKGWNMQTWPSKVGLPIGLFSALPSHEVAQEIAETQYLPDEMDESIDKLVRHADRKKVFGSLCFILLLILTVTIRSARSETIMKMAIPRPRRNTSQSPRYEGRPPRRKRSL